MNKGKIIQIIGPVVDVEFPEGTNLPEIYHALKVKNGDKEVILEVVKHLDLTKVKAISMHSTDGLQRGSEVEDLGRQIEVPVGQEVLGNLFNVIGQPLNESGRVSLNVMTNSAGVSIIRPRVLLVEVDATFVPINEVLYHIRLFAECIAYVVPTVKPVVT